MAAKTQTAEQQLDAFLVRFTPDVAAVARAALVTMRKRTPGAIEMVYDNYNALVIGFAPNERASDAIFSIALYANGVSLCFLQGAGLPDPHQRLQGSGNVARHIRLAEETGGAKLLDDPQVRQLIGVAMERAKVPFNPKQERRLVIRSVSEKQRPRRPNQQKK